MRLIKPDLNVRFMRYGPYMVMISAILVLASLVSLATRGLNFGLDFTGGTLIEVVYHKEVDLSDVRKTLAGAGFDQAVVQSFGTLSDIVIRLPSQGNESNAQISTRVLQALRSSGAGVDMRRVEYVGPQVGNELKEKGALSVIYAVIGILIYVWLRFEWRFSVGAIAAVVHDSIITLGVFSFLHINFDLTVLAAILAVIGYSLNDTIVIFDRVRENFRAMRKESPRNVMTYSINQTLARTVMTALTTLLVLIALFFLGGEVVHGFALALIVGIFVGTYSSIYVAGILALWLGVSRHDMMPVKKEGDQAESLP